MKIILHNLLASVLALLLLRLAFWMVGQFVRETTARMNALFGLIGDAYRQSGRSFRWPGLHRAMPYVVAIALLLVAFKASAQPSPNVGVLDDLVGQYKQASGGWFNTLFHYAQVLFGLLAMIEFSWAAAVWALEKDSMQSWFAALVRKIMSVGFFYALLLNAPIWIPSIIDSLVQAGQAAGNTGPLSPSGVVAAGQDCALQIMQSLSNLGLLENIGVALVADLAALVILGCFAIIGCVLAVTLIESYFALGGMILFLGFGGSRWTSDFANKVVNYAFTTGVKLFVIYIMIGLGMNETTNWAQSLASTSIGNNYIAVCFSVLTGSILFGYITVKIPAIAASFLSGTPTLSAFEGIGMVAGAAAGAGALLSYAANGKSASKALFDAARNGMGGGSGPGGSPALAAASGGSISNAAGLGFGSSSGGSSAGGSTAGKAAMVSPPPVSGASSASSGGSGNSPAMSASQPPSSGASAPSAPASAPPPAAAESAASAGGSTSTAAAASEESDAPPPVASVPPPALPSAPAPAAVSGASKLATGSTDKAAPASSSAPSTSAPSAAPAAASAPASAINEAAKGFGSENSIGGDSSPGKEKKEEPGRPRPTFGEVFDKLRNEIPSDYAGDGTANIKLDHSHD